MRKTETIKIRLSREEKQTFEEVAGLSGIAVSAWMRDRLRRAARRELQDANQPVPFLRSAERD
jgi:uncharacterized protein (DUF1778 family)